MALPVSAPLAREHTRTQALRFWAKASVFRLRRTLQNLGSNAPRQLAINRITKDWTTVAESRSGLYPSDKASEFALQAGKVQNLRTAAKYLNGLSVPAGEVFSFWRHVPRPVKGRGFVRGRELREGCIIPSVGGGLCQLSNALYDAALRAGCEIIERHAHSRIIPGSMAAQGRDATVFWNYVDLRFRSRFPFQIEVQLTRTELIVRFRSSEPVSNATIEPCSTPPVPTAATASPVESCESCGVVSCFRHIPKGALPEEASTAWLVDGWWPEFDTYLEQMSRPKDVLFVPVNGTRFRLTNYRWNTSRFKTTHEFPWFVLCRSLASRRLATQGAQRQMALQHFSERLANLYLRAIPEDATHLVIAQDLLPFIWNSGALGGRTFDVLMTRLPLAELQAKLDSAYSRHPQSKTLADFRADSDLINAEAVALAEARTWITPHSQIAALAGTKALKLNWHIPANATTAAPGKRLVFPASTLGRKGAYELREALREFPVPVTLCGPSLELNDFWQGIDVRFAEEDWLSDAAAVVLPAWVEHQPRRLLRAVAAGIPVIASDACGLENVKGCTTFPIGDVPALIQSLRKVFEQSIGAANTYCAPR